MSCCPESHLYYHYDEDKEEGGERCCKQEGCRGVDDGPDAGEVVQWSDAVRPSGVYPHGCRTGSNGRVGSGYAKCVVVALRLPANNLAGGLDAEHLSGFEDSLAVLQLGDNRLSGPLPTEALGSMMGGGGRLRALNLTNNTFEYVEGACHSLAKVRLFAAAQPATSAPSATGRRLWAARQIP